MPHAENSVSDRRPRVDRLLAAAVALVAFALLLATSRDFGEVWDEGNTIEREKTLAHWFAIVSGNTGRPPSDAFRRETLERYWPFAREEPDGHTPFFAEISLAGWRLTRGGLAPRTAYRVGPMLLASLTCGLIFLHLARRHGRLAGFTASGAILLIPQCFALEHYAHYDMPMSCCWLLAQAAFIQALRNPRWIVPFGVLVGLSAGSKFTGCFSVAAPLGWVVLFEWLPRVRLIDWRPRAEGERVPMPGTRALLLAAPIAFLTLYAILPPWWGDPITGVRRFLASNLSRHDTVRIPTLYLGQIYGFALPWHNSIVITAVTVPVLVLALGLLGIGDIVARRSAGREDAVWILSWLVLMVIRALPNAPGHDGVRQLLASTLSLAVLAGIGAGALVRWLGAGRLRWVGPVVASAALAECVVGIVQLYPYTLSYYNVAIGGLKGAERHGFELTFYWDTAGPEFLDWVKREQTRRPVALRFPIGLTLIPLLREWGEMPKGVKVVPMEYADDPDYVVQRRKGVFYPYDWWLERNGHPRFAIRRQGVDLLRVYPYEQSLRAFLETRDEKIPEHLRNY